MEKIKKLYNVKLVLTVTLLFFICLSAFFIGYTRFSEPELNENRLLEICGIYVDDEQYLYISTNMGVLVFNDTECVGKLDVSSHIRIKVEKDKVGNAVVIILDNAIDKVYVFNRDGSQHKSNNTSSLPTEMFKSDRFIKGEHTYKVHRILGYNFITENGRLSYKSPVGEYLVRVLAIMTIPCFMYLGFGILEYGIRSGKDKAIKDLYKMAWQELFKK